MPRLKLADETEFIPTDLRQARRLHVALVDSGTPVAQARGIVSWLIMLPQQDAASGQLRTTYRRELARLGTPPWRPRSRVSATRAKGAYVRSDRRFARRIDRFRATAFGQKAA